MPSQIFSQDLITLSPPPPAGHKRSERLIHQNNNPPQLTPTTSSMMMMSQLCGGGGNGKSVGSKVKEFSDRLHHHPHQKINLVTSSSSGPDEDINGSSSVKGHICDIYCTECESAAKRSRTLLLSTGGDVIITTASAADGIGDGINNWLAECRTDGGGGVGFGGGRKSNFSVNLNVPSFDIRTHQLVINVSIENKKISDDLNIINRNLSQLKQSGWYFEDLNYQDAQNLLAKTERGTFLLRNSSDAKFLFSLSVQTERGPTSVRINFYNGKFQLDADKKFNDILPKESSVVGLLENHLRTSKKSGQVWVEPNGKFYSPVVLTRPLQRHVPTLQHLSRVAVNQLQLTSSVPPGMRRYMDAYPFKI